MAEGVKGLLIAKRDSLVVWAFSRVAESRRICRGFGGFEMGVAGVVLDALKEDENCFKRANVDAINSFNARKSSALGGAIFSCTSFVYRGDDVVLQIS